MNKITIFSFYSGKHALTQGISFLFTSFSLARPGSLAFSVLSFSNNVLCPFVLAVALSPLLPLTHLLASHWPRLSGTTLAPMAVLSLTHLLASHRPCLSGTTLAPMAVLSLSPLCCPSLCCPPCVTPRALSLLGACQPHLCVLLSASRDPVSLILCFLLCTFSGYSDENKSQSLCPCAAHHLMGKLILGWQNWHS